MWPCVLPSSSEALSRQCGAPRGCAAPARRLQGPQQVSQSCLVRLGSLRTPACCSLINKQCHSIEGPPAWVLAAVPPPLPPLPAATATRCAAGICMSNQPPSASNSCC